MEALPQVSANPILVVLVSKAFEFGFLAFAVVYFIFTLIVLKQINLMTATIKTEGGGIIKALAILYAGLALGVIVLMIGLF